MATPFETMLGGKLISGILQVYTDLIGDWFFAIALGSIMVLIYFKSKNITLVSIMLMILGGALSSYGMLPGEAVYTFYVIIALSLTGIFYGIWKSSR